MDWFHHTAVPAPIAGAQSWILAPDAQLLHLSAHYMTHGGPDRAPLIWAHDIAELIARHGAELDWHAILSRAQQYSLTYALRTTLIHLHHQWHVPVPSEALAALSARHAASAEKRYYRLRARTHSPLARLWVHAASLGGWGKRLRYLGGTLFPSPAYMRWRYRVQHTLLLPLSYLQRLLRGFLPRI
jgi:hypothetical protein